MKISSEAYIIDAEDGCNRLASELSLKFSVTKMKMTLWPTLFLEHIVFYY